MGSTAAVARPARDPARKTDQRCTFVHVLDPDLMEALSSRSAPTMPQVYQRHLHEFSMAVQERAHPQVEGHFSMSGQLRPHVRAGPRRAESDERGASDTHGRPPHGGRVKGGTRPAVPDRTTRGLSW